MNDEIYSDGGFEDISSSTVPRTKSSLKAVTENYGNGVFKHLDKIMPLWRSGYLLWALCSR